MAQGAEAAGALLRPLREADLAAVAALETALFGAEAWSAGVLAAELEAALDPQADRVYVVVEGPRPPTRDGAPEDDAPEDDAPGDGVRRDLLGYAGLWFGDGRGDADLLTIATVPAARRGGLATAMLTHLLDEARRRGCEHVLLEVRRSNTAAQALYERHGFEVLGVRRRYYTGPDEDALVMRRRLRPSSGPGPVGSEAVAPDR